MEMEKLLLFMIASVGATLIVTLSAIFEPFRSLFQLSSAARENSILEGQEKATPKEKVILFFKDLFGCPMCFGFWMGGVMYFFVGYKVTDLSDFGIWFAHCCATSVLSILAYVQLKK